jgi:hypothetical protein
VEPSPLLLRSFIGLLYQPWKTDGVDCGLNEWQGKPKYRSKPAPVPLSAPQIPHDLTRARTRAIAVASRWLTAWATGRPASNRPAHRPTLWSWALTGSPPVVWPVPGFYGTRRFITAFTTALHLFLSRARPIQSTPPHPISTRSSLMLSVHLCLRLPSGLFPSGLCYQLTIRFLSSLFVLHASFQIFPSAPCSQIHWFHLRSYTPILSSSLNVRDKASHPYRTTGKIIVLYILLFTFFNRRRGDKRFWTEW